MKVMLLLFFVCSLYGDDIQRIDAIVSDIQQLRIDYNKSQNDLKLSKKRVKYLENKLKIATNLLKTKENKNYRYEEKQINNLNTQRNKFPKLKMRTKLVFFKASAFRLNKDAFIYADLYKKKLYKWEKGTSFTSNQYTQDYIKITGYFKNKIWTHATMPLWIKITDVVKREKNEKNINY